MSAARFAVVVVVLVAALTGSPADAQGVWGRRGFSWQPEIELAKEEQARLQAELDRLPTDVWRQRALAWLEVERAEELRLLVTESSRVGDLAFQKQAAVRALGDVEVPSAWEIVFPKRVQSTMGVEMTDVDRTRVACPLGAVSEAGGSLGVFQHQGVLLCIARRPRAGGGQP